MNSPDVDTVLRLHAPWVLVDLLRRGGTFEECEEAVQEALVAAGALWEDTGVPADAGGWIYAAAARQLGLPSAVADPGDAPAHDDVLRLLVFCCHPALTSTSRIGLVLRAVGGLTTAQIARSFLAAADAMGQRISRAKQTIAASGPSFTALTDADREARLPAVLEVLHRVFTEGQVASAGSDGLLVPLADEAIRIARLALSELPDDGELRGLLGLMLLTDARRSARVDAAGELVPLAHQDRTQWDPDLVAEGLRHVQDAMSWGTPGPYRLHAAIAAEHAAAPTAADTDWGEILDLFDRLVAVAPWPMVLLDRAIAVAEVHGDEHGLAALEQLGHDERIAGQARFLAARASLLDRSGRPDAARNDFAAAALVAGTDAERRYLERRAHR